MISLMVADEFARFMWVRVRGVSLLPRDIYIVVCYFPPASSSYVIHNGCGRDPFVDLYVGIAQRSAVGEVILLGHFNSRTRALQIPLHNQFEDVYCI